MAKLRPSLVLAPQPPRRENTPLYKVAFTNAAGQFKFNGILPADYKVFAWEQVPNGAWLNADFLQVYEARGRPVTVKSGPASNVQLDVIPAAASNAQK